MRKYVQTYLLNKPKKKKPVSSIIFKLYLCFEWIICSKYKLLSKVQKVSLPSSYSLYKTLLYGLVSCIAGKKFEAILIPVPLHLVYFSFLSFPFLFESFRIFFWSLFFWNFIMLCLHMGLFFSTVVNILWTLSIWQLISFSSEIFLK